MVQANPIDNDVHSGFIPSPLRRDDAYALARSTDTDLIALMLAAASLRRQHKGQVVTYSRNVFLPLTKLCRNRCAYCAFSTQASDVESAYMTPEAVLSVARAGAKAGCKEALFCLGERPESRYAEARQALRRLGYSSTAAYMRAMCDLVLQETGLLPHCNAGVLTEEEWAMLADVCVSAGLMLESTSDGLCAAGGAHYACPGKLPAARIASIAAAGSHHIPFTTGILIGIGETPEERVDALFAIRALHEQYGHIQEVIVQNFLPHPGTPMAEWPAAGTLDMLRTLALARLILGGEIGLQAPPNLAPSVYQLYLLAGIDDWGGVSPVTDDLINPDEPWPEISALRDVTAAAGFTLRERLAVYPSFLQRPGFVRQPLRAKLEPWVDASGYVRATRHE
jgi:FO synthase